MLPLDTGISIGALLGGRLNPTFSLNGELRFATYHRQVLPESFSAGDHVVEIDAALSPLFHHRHLKAEFVGGPKLGVYAGFEPFTSSDSADVKRTAYGVTFGGNAGMFFGVTRTMSLGVLPSYTIRHAIRHCVSRFGNSQVCNQGENPTEHVIAFHLAALF
jgi:hypothetical protein